MGSFYSNCGTDMRNEHLSTHTHNIIDGPVNRAKSPTKSNKVKSRERESRRAIVDKKNEQNKWKPRQNHVKSKYEERKNRVFTVHSLKWLNESKKMKKTFSASDSTFLCSFSGTHNVARTLSKIVKPNAQSEKKMSAHTNITEPLNISGTNAISFPPNHS